MQGNQLPSRGWLPHLVDMLCYVSDKRRHIGKPGVAYLSAMPLLNVLQAPRIIALLQANLPRLPACGLGHVTGDFAEVGRTVGGRDKALSISLRRVVFSCWGRGHSRWRIKNAALPSQIIFSVLSQLEVSIGGFVLLLNESSFIGLALLLVGLGLGLFLCLDARLVGGIGSG